MNISNRGKNIFKKLADDEKNINYKSGNPAIDIMIF